MNPSGEKTEQATPRRLIKARKEGQFAASHDFVSGLQFTVFVILIAQTGPSLLAALKDVTRGLFVEAFRGDVLVWLRIDPAGNIDRCHLRDASWFQWPLLEVAIEGNIVADFPLCNKSFNCSYSGHDL